MSSTYWWRNCNVLDQDRTRRPEHRLRTIETRLKVEDIDGYLDKIAAKVASYEPKFFCHNDLHTGNILLTSKGLKIIDFDHANYGYRGYDIAFWLVHRGPSDITKFLQGSSTSTGSLINGYISVTKTTYEKISQEVCTFVAYEIMNRLMAKEQKSDEWFVLFQDVFRSCFD